jgi:hypothetical protein
MKDDLTMALDIILRKWPNDVQTAKEWAESLPYSYGATPSKVKTRLNNLERDGVAKKIEHRGSNGKVVATYYGLAD